MRALVIVAIGLGASACDSCSAPSASPVEASAPSASASAAPSTSIAVSASTAPALPPPLMRLPCRFLGPTPPGAPAAAEDFKWLEVPAGSIATAKDPTTARETNFQGPLRARICVEGEEESWIAPLDKPGSFSSTRGSGEGLGAEEWVMTPLGVVRYVAAMVKVTVSPTVATIALVSGSIDVWPAEGTTLKIVDRDGGASDAATTRPDEGWQRFDGAATMTITAKDTAVVAAAASKALEACRSAGTKARGFAIAIGQPDASLATLAPQHVVARRLARAACGVARVRASTLPVNAANAAIAKDAVGADAIWRKLGADTGDAGADGGR